MGLEGSRLVTDDQAALGSGGVRQEAERPFCLGRPRLQLQRLQTEDEGVENGVSYSQRLKIPWHTPV